MEPVVIVLQVLTIAISVVSMILTVVNTVRENGKKNYIKVVTAQRLENKRCVRDSAQTLLELTHEAALEHADSNTVQECISSLTKIMVILKEVYAQEHEMIGCGEKLISSLKAYIEKTGTKDDVAAARARFYELFSIYDFADWEFIKLQSRGKHRDSRDFDIVYGEIKQMYSK